MIYTVISYLSDFSTTENAECQPYGHHRNNVIFSLIHAFSVPAVFQLFIEVCFLNSFNLHILQRDEILLIRVSTYR